MRFITKNLIPIQILIIISAFLFTAYKTIWTGDFKIVDYASSEDGGGKNNSYIK